MTPRLHMLAARQSVLHLEPPRAPYLVVRVGVSGR